jgi:hypothetical protein
LKWSNKEERFLKKLSKVGLINYAQILLIIALSTAIFFFIFLKLNLDILALIMSVVSLSLTILSTVNKSIEEKRTSEVKRIEARSYDKDLFNDIENSVNELRNEGKIIDSLHMVEACGFTDHRKEAIIVYH